MPIAFSRATPDNYRDTSDTWLTGTPFTISAWVNAPDTTGTKNICSIGNSSLSTQSFRMQLDAQENLRAHVESGPGGPFPAESSNAVTPGVWGHCLGRWTSPTLRECWIDGDDGNKGSNTTSRTPTGLNQRAIGVAFFDGIHQGDFEGDIAWLTLWSAALNLTEIQALAAGASPMRIRPQSIIACYPMFTADTVPRNIARTDFSNWGTTEGSPATGTGNPPISAGLGFDVGWRGALAAPGGDGTDMPWPIAPIYASPPMVMEHHIAAFGVVDFADLVTESLAGPGLAGPGLASGGLAG